MSLDALGPAWLAFLLRLGAHRGWALRLGHPVCPLPSLGNLRKSLLLWVWAALALTMGCVKGHFCF